MTPEEINRLEGESVNANITNQDYSVRAIIRKGKCYYIDDSPRTVLSGQIRLHPINPEEIKDIKKYQNNSDLAKFIQNAIRKSSSKLENGLNLTLLENSWDGNTGY